MERTSPKLLLIHLLKKKMKFREVPIVKTTKTLTPWEMMVLTKIKWSWNKLT